MIFRFSNMFDILPLSLVFYIYICFYKQALTKVDLINSKLDFSE